MKLTADKVIFVSNYLQKTISVNQHNIVLTTLSFEFINISTAYLLEKREKNCPYNNILMVSSLKVYKGVLIFLDLARKLPEYKFCLVAGSDHKEVLNFIKTHNPPKNFIIYSAQSNLHPFYQNADILVNLTIPSYCIGSFGLTILEGMAYGLPIIAPPAEGLLKL
ncbi:MAG: glycosyltransferase family 4 protein [Ignavibacteriales bacterium]|nr:glycosyltransferase family 4 protein [Ignavibacteriales bacterium]